MESRNIWTESGLEMAESLKKKWRQAQKTGLENRDCENKRHEDRYCVHNGWMGQDIRYFEEIDSTNTEAKRLAADGAPHGTVVIANQQTAGKGRRGRMWESPKDSGIFMTLLLRPQIELSKISMLTLVAALAVAKAVEEETQCQCQIKWPNDLVMDKKKICGILTEMGSSGNQAQYVVVGIGINVSQMVFTEELKEKATSLCLQTGKKLLRADLIEKVMRRFEEYYEMWEAQGDLSVLREEYEQKLVNLGSEVVVLAVEGEYSGRAVGITNTGELKVLTQTGELKEILSGEVSVRGVYGYV